MTYLEAFRKVLNDDTLEWGEVTDRFRYACIDDVTMGERELGTGDELNLARELAMELEQYDDVRILNEVSTAHLTIYKG